MSMALQAYQLGELFGIVLLLDSAATQMACEMLAKPMTAELPSRTLDAMRKALVLGGLFTFASAIQPLAAADAKSFTAISPIFGELVAFSLPASFTVANEQSSKERYIREAVLKGETVDQWSQMITVTGFKGLAADEKVTPQSFAANIASGFKQACPETFFAKGLREIEVNGHGAFVALASCGKVDQSADKHSETALIVAIKGEEDYYTVQWAERTPSSAENLTFDEAKWEQRLKQLDPIKVCEIVEGEAAPYPSCVNRE